LPVYKEITLDLAASFGYFKGDDSYWKTYESSTGDYTGKNTADFMTVSFRLDLQYLL
jgi:hypothetical protein